MPKLPMEVSGQELRKGFTRMIIMQGLDGEREILLAAEYETEALEAASDIVLAGIVRNHLHSLTTHGATPTTEGDSKQ